MYWRMEVEKTHQIEKVCKESVTFLACCNADGSQTLKLLVIENAKNEMEFQNVNMSVEYKLSADAWIITEFYLTGFNCI